MIAFEIVLNLTLFALGASIASFLIALVYRIELGIPLKRLISEGSQCEWCNKPLRWNELVPIFSYLWQRGKCSNCGAKISLSYPIFELVFGFTLVLLYNYGVAWSYYILAIFLFFLAVYDFYHKGFPKFVMHGLLVLSLPVFIYNTVVLYQLNIYPVVMSVVIGAIVLLLNRMKRAFGVGDLLALLMISLFVTLKELVAIIFISIILAGIVATVLLALKRMSRKDSIPFVPFLYFGFLLFYPLESLVDRYFTYILYLW